ncbi:gamma-glutamylcyclotransferase family protein [Longimicrobium sp.]|uniref:gamma-glutamylcyclotransferase family protein n=1 Tax=Longimicrobium sp. TaxID=2029185 RepID=UPI002BB51016|nr:gamma-glutamylcyclotransferase family protein [Longimicrobium sp.]HSU14539.1 gamma-glutamylcyclotransferase family protein [Longimicrobium sp.]
MEIRRLFVYGSLRQGEENEMARLLHARSRYLGAGTIRARLYAISWYAGAVASADAGDVVRGDLFELDAGSAGEVMAALDAYEGSDFRLSPVDVEMPGETPLRAHAYLYAASAEGLPWIRHGDWPRSGSAAGEAGNGRGATGLAHPAEPG